MQIQVNTDANIEGRDALVRQIEAEVNRAGSANLNRSISGVSA